VAENAGGSTALLKLRIIGRTHIAAARGRHHRATDKLQIRTGQRRQDTRILAGEAVAQRHGQGVTSSGIC
jgi:hypothetical protein